MHDCTVQGLGRAGMLRRVDSGNASASARQLRVVSEAYEVEYGHVIQDANTIWRWGGGADEPLIARFRRENEWPEDLAMSYIGALRRLGEWSRESWQI
jgi:hypothetical protein